MKDYLVDLLCNHKKYEAKIEVLKKHQHLFHDQDEFDSYMKLEQDILLMKFCIDKLSPKGKESIENLYIKGFTESEFAKVTYLTKSGVKNRKRVAIRELKELMGLEHQKEEPKRV